MKLGLSALKHKQNIRNMESFKNISKQEKILDFQKKFYYFTNPLTKPLVECIFYNEKWV
jgi:hypothetical protein